MPTPQNFATRIAPDVIYNCINTGVFPSVVIAQAILESGSGTSKQAQNMNNLFGHAASALWTGKKARTVPNGHFWRVYDSVSQCIAAHINILKKPAYRLAGVIVAKTPFAQAMALQTAGYNTGQDRSRYAQKLSGIITSSHLQQYDQQLFAIERSKNKNHLAFHEQGPVTKIVHTIFG